MINPNMEIWFLVGVEGIYRDFYIVRPFSTSLISSDFKKAKKPTY